MAAADLQTIDWTQMARCLFSDSQDALFVFRRSDLRLIQVNPSAEQLTGFSEQQLQQLSLDDLLSSEHLDTSTRFLAACQAARSFDVTDQFRLVQFRGESMAVTVSVSFVSAAPEAIGVLCVRDQSRISELQQQLHSTRKKLRQTVLQHAERLESNEARLRRKTEQYKRLIDDIDAIVWEADYPFSGMNYVSNQLESMLGYAVEDWTSDPNGWSNAIIEEDREWAINTCRSYCELGEDHEFEYRVQTSDGRILWVNDRVHVVKDDVGRPKMLRGAILNITDRKEAQEQTRRREAQYRLLVENAPLCIHSIDESGNLSSINATGIRMIGASDRAEVLGREYLSLVDEQDRERIQSLLDQAYCDKRSDFEFTATVNGQRRLFRSNFIPIKDTDGVVRKIIGTTEDVTARRRAEEALRRSEEMFRQLVENMDAVYWMRSIDPDGQDSYVSPQYDEVWERQSEVLTDKVKSMADAIVPEDQGSHSEAISALREDGTEFDIEYRIRRPSGEVRWIRDRGFAIRDEFGRAIRLAGLAEDITSGIKTLEQLRIQDRAIAFAEAGIVIADARLDDMPIIFCNPAFERMTGYSQQEAIGRNCRFLQAHDTEQPAVKKLRKAIREGRECREVLRNYRKDGTMFWNEVSVSPVHDQSGEITHFVGFWNDISSRVAGESQVRDSEHRFRTLCRDAPMGIFLTDVDGKCHYINEIGTRIIGRTEQEIYGDGWANALHPDDRQRTLATWQQSLANRSVYDNETRYLHDDGSVCWVHVRANARLSDQGELLGYVGSFNDITERKHTLEALEQSEQRYRTLVEDAPEAIMVGEMDNGRFVDWNDATLRLFRTDAETIAKKTVFDFFPEKQPDGRDSIEAARDTMSASLAGESLAFEWIHIDSEGNEIPSEVRLTGLTYGGRQLVRICD